MHTALTKRIGKDSRSFQLLADFCIQKHTDYEKAIGPFRKKWGSFQKLGDGDLSDRDSNEESDIYSRENKSLEFITSMRDFMVARASDDLFGSDPYLAVIPVGRADQKLAGQMTKHAEFKLRQARFKQCGRDAIMRGFTVGVGIPKVAWRRETDISDRLATVLMGRDAAGKRNPVETMDGELIEDGDFLLADEQLGLALWSKSPVMRMPDDAEFKLLVDFAPLPILVNPDGQPITAADDEYFFESDVRFELDADAPQEGDEQAPDDESGEAKIRFLSKSEIISQTPDMEFEERLIEEDKVTFEGLHVGCVNVMDFVAPMNVECLEDADLVGMTVGIRLSRLIADYDLDEATITRLRNDTTAPKSAANKPIEHLSEATSDSSAGEVEERDPEILCYEDCVTYDIFRDRRPRRLFVLTAVQERLVLFADYRANVTADGMLPYRPVVPIPVPGRWWGRGFFEIYANHMDFMDRLFSGLVYRNNMHVNPIKLVRPEVLVDGETKKSFQLKPDATFKVKKEYDGKEFMTFLKFEQLDDMTWKIIELIMQMDQVRSGVSSAAAGSMTNLPGMETATGTNSIMMSGSTLHKLPIENCKDGLEGAALLAIKTLYANQNVDETVTITEGDADQLVTITAASVKGLDVNVRLLLTRLHEKEALDQAAAALKIVMDYLLTIPEAEKEAVRPLVIQELKALRITGADSIVRHANPPVQSDGTDPDMSVKESMSYKDAPPSIKRQMEQRAGYQPATDEEHAAEIAAKKKEGAEKPESTGPEKDEPTGEEAAAPSEPMPVNAAA